MSNDLDTTGLEAGTTEAKTVDTANEEKRLAKVEAVNAGVEALVEVGVSENLAKICEAAKAWYSEAEDKNAAKEALIEAFDGVDNLKDYATNGELEAEIEKFSNLGKALSTLTSIRHFYARRKGGKGRTKKAKMQTISMENELYQVSADYLAEIADKPKDEKIQLLKAHELTTKEAITEL